MWILIIIIILLVLLTFYYYLHPEKYLQHKAKHIKEGFNWVSPDLAYRLYPFRNYPRYYTRRGYLYRYPPYGTPGYTIYTRTRGVPCAVPQKLSAYCVNERLNEGYTPKRAVDLCTPPPTQSATCLNYTLA
jgi:hypothetical protein